MRPRYQINIHFSGNQYVALVPELAGCEGTGSTYQEALSSAEEAIKQWVMETISAGRTVPAPGALKATKLRTVKMVAPFQPVETKDHSDMRKLLTELVTDTYSYRRRRFRSQVGFWERFGVGQSTGSRYERVVDGKVRQLPLPLAILVGLHAIDCVRDQDLATVYEMLEPFYPGRPHLELVDLEQVEK